MPGESIAIEINAIDNATAVMNNVASATQRISGGIVQFQEKLTRRFSFIAGEVMMENLRGLGVQIPGIGRLIDTLGSGIMSLTGVFPGVGLALAGFTSALALIPKVMEDVTEKSAKMNAETYKTLGIITRIDDVTKAWTERSVAGQMDRIKAVDEEIKAMEKQRNAIIMVQDTLRGNIDLYNQLDEELQIYANTDLAVVEQNIAGKIKEREELQSNLKHYTNYYEEKEKKGREATEKILEGEMKAQKASLKYTEDINKKIEEENKRHFTFGVAIMESSLNALGVAMGDFMASGMTSWEKFVSDMAGVFIDVIIKIVEETVLAMGILDIITGDIAGGLAEIAVGTALIGGLYALKSEIKTALATGAGAPGGSYDVAPVSAGIGIGETMAGALTAGAGSGAGGSAVKTGYSQVVNYITIAPEFDMLEVSQVSEQRLKEISMVIGRYIQEGMATGNFGLKR